jgi:hypothetical protein
MTSLRDNSDGHAEGKNGVDWVGRAVKYGVGRMMNDAWIYSNDTQLTLWLLFLVSLL